MKNCTLSDKIIAQKQFVSDMPNFIPKINSLNQANLQIDPPNLFNKLMLPGILNSNLKKHKIRARLTMFNNSEA
jgi:hypothetical protein